MTAVRRRDVTSLGITSHELTTRLHDGTWQRLARGLYAPTAQGPIDWLTLHEIQSYSPRTVFCLETALLFHALSDARPRAVWIAVARGARRPKLGWVRCQFVTVAPALWELGVESFVTPAGPLRLTNVARTLVDCFRFRRRVGLETALAALRDARADQRVSPDALLTMARAFRQDRVILPYLEAVG